jgi:uncharacterized protein (DUF4415 family)
MTPEIEFAMPRGNQRYEKAQKQSVTIRLDTDTVEYFKALSTELELPYQTLINLYLRDCATSQRKISLRWRPQRLATG